jgi:hypothetical protein
VFVWRAERAGGDTKTPKSRRTLALPRKCVEALREQREQREQQAKDRRSAGPFWRDHNLVFASAVGRPLDDHNVRRQFRVITEEAGLGKTWVPREARRVDKDGDVISGVGGAGDEESATAPARRTAVSFFSPMVNRALHRNNLPQEGQLSSGFWVKTFVAYRSTRASVSWLAGRTATMICGAEGRAAESP